MELLTVIKSPAARGAAVRDPTHQLSVHVLYVCRVLLISAPFMHCVHRHMLLAPRVLHFSAVHYNSKNNGNPQVASVLWIAIY